MEAPIPTTISGEQIGYTLAAIEADTRIDSSEKDKYRESLKNLKELLDKYPNMALPLLTDNGFIELLSFL